MKKDYNVGEIKSIVFDDDGGKNNVFGIDSFMVQFVGDFLCLVCEIPIVGYHVVLPIIDWKSIEILRKSQSLKNT